MNQAIKDYNAAKPADRKPICELLAQEIDHGLPDAENKIWHGSPVWFLEGNPIVGYDKLKDSVRLLFWSGQSFDESGLKPEDSLKAAEARYSAADQVNRDDLANGCRNQKKFSGIITLSSYKSPVIWGL